MAVAGGRARGATRVVKTTSNQVEVQEHLPVVAFPCDEPRNFTSKYVTHMKPTTGTGLALAEQLVTTIRERDIQVKVIGMDGCAVNTGQHNGAIRLVELLINGTVQWVICGLHLNELLWWHILSDTNGVTKGPEKLSGLVGSTLHEDLWLLPVVAFSAISGKVRELPEEVVAQLSRDQALAYKYGH